MLKYGFYMKYLQLPDTPHNQSINCVVNCYRQRTGKTKWNRVKAYFLPFPIESPHQHSSLGFSEHPATSQLPI